MQKVWLNSAYRGHSVEVAQTQFGWQVEVVSAEKPPGGFVVQARRWVVERTFAWLRKNRRLSKDHEEQVETSRAWIWLAMAHILLQRIARRLGGH